MSQPGDWSPDESSSGEAFEQGDEARDERERTDPAFAEDAEVDPSLDPTLQVDERELDEADAEPPRSRRDGHPRGWYRRPRRSRRTVQPDPSST